MDTFYTSQTASFKNTSIKPSTLLAELDQQDQMQQKAIVARGSFQAEGKSLADDDAQSQTDDSLASYPVDQSQEMTRIVSNKAGTHHMHHVIVEETDNLATSSEHIEFDNPHAVSRDDKSLSSFDAMSKGCYDINQASNHLQQDNSQAQQQLEYQQPGLVKMAPKTPLQNIEHTNNFKTGQENYLNINNRPSQVTQNDGGTTSQNSPSCYHAVIAAASTNMYRSSHCSTYQNNHFDADDESDQHRNSYMNLLQSHNSMKQTPLEQLNSGQTSSPNLIMLTKSPSEHMISISEEHSTRKLHKHLKSGSLPEFPPQRSVHCEKQLDLAAAKQTSDQDRDRSNSLPTKENVAGTPSPKEADCRKNTGTNVDCDIQDSLQHRTERGDLLSSSARDGQKQKDDGPLTYSAYQDSLDSLTPQSKRVVGDSAFTPVTDPAARKDKYDVTNVSHKQYFMPQAYPPASSLKKSEQRSKSPISDNSCPDKKPESQQDPPLRQIDTSEPEHDKAEDLSPSFRQQTFKPIELKKYTEPAEPQATTPGGCADSDSERPTNHHMSSYDAVSNNKSVQDLHTRNNELQSRIGNLEQILMARLAEKNDDEDHPSDYMYPKEIQKKTEAEAGKHARNRSASQSSNSKISYVYTEDHNAAQSLAPEDYKSSHRLTGSHRFLNEEPALGQHTPGIKSLTGLTSHRSAADIVRMHHQRFQTQESQNPLKAGEVRPQNCIYGSYYLTTEDQEQQTQQAASAAQNSYRNTITSKEREERQESKRGMNIQDDTVSSSKRSMNADTDVDENHYIQTEDNWPQPSQQQQDPSSTLNQATKVQNLLVDETMQRVVASHNLQEEADHLQSYSNQYQEKERNLLQFLENQNAEALRAIQHENSAFIQQQQQFRGCDASLISADLVKTQQDLGRLEHHQSLSEFQTTTVHEANNDTLNDSPQFLMDHSQITIPEKEQQLVASSACDKCQCVTDLNEALSEENERLRDHMESMILMVQQFEVERTRFTDQNNVKITALENQVEFLQGENETSHQSKARDQEETIKSLQAHVKNLERTNFKHELNTVNISANMNQSQTLKQESRCISQSQSRYSQDKEWKKRVNSLENELIETKDFYLKRIEALEKGQNVFTDTSIFVAGESVDDSMAKIEDVPFCASKSQHEQRVQSHERHNHLMHNAGVDSQSQADRANLYEKLGLAEQVLEQITEELSLLSAENRFLSKLNKRLTYHACRQEKYFMDWRKQSALKGSQFSQHSRCQSSYIGTQSVISTQEVVLEPNTAQDISKDISKEKVNQVLSEAEQILSRSERRHKNHTKDESRSTTTAQNASTVIDKKQSLQDSLEVLEIARVYIQENPVSFANQVQALCSKLQSKTLTVEQFVHLMANVRVPISLTDARRLFHFIYTGLRDPSEPDQSKTKVQRHLSITDLCKVIDQTDISRSRENLLKDQQKSVTGTQSQVPPRHLEAVMRTEDLKKQTATIESSEAQTYGGARDQSIGAGSNTSIPVNHRTSGFYDQQRRNQMDLQADDKNMLHMNSIIQLEDQMRAKKEKYGANQDTDGNRALNGSSMMNTIEDFPRQMVAERDGKKSSNKVEELKKRIERLSRKAKKTMNEKTLQPHSQDSLNRSTSEDRATQTISGSNQYKRGNRGASKETNQTAIQPCK